MKTLNIPEKLGADSSLTRNADRTENVRPTKFIGSWGLMTSLGSEVADGRLLEQTRNLASDQHSHPELEDFLNV